jgi:PAS domain S-box-containing protein
MKGALTHLSHGGSGHFCSSEWRDGPPESAHSAERHRTGQKLADSGSRDNVTGEIAKMSSTTKQQLSDAILRVFPQQTNEYACIILDRDGRIVGWRGAAELIFGYAEEEVLGAPGALIFTTEDAARGLDRHELAVAGRDSRSDDCRWHVRKDGTRIWASGSVEAVRDEAGDVLGYVKLVRDRTDLRIQVEGLENEAAALRQRLQTKRQVLQTMAHEMRNSLAPLLNTANLLERAPQGDATHRKAEIIRTQVATLSRLANDLLNVVGMESGHFELQKGRVDLRDLIQQQIAGFAPMASERQLLLEAILPAGPLLAELDRTRFVQVIQNLVINAIKYTPAGGRIWCKATQEGPEVVLRVQDTGIGIDAATLPRIFDLFTRGREAADLEPHGLGVGLAIAYQIVTQHGGSIQARSAGADKGSEFSVRLPALIESKAGRHAREQLERVRSSLRQAPRAGAIVRLPVPKLRGNTATSSPARRRLICCWQAHACILAGDGSF